MYYKHNLEQGGDPEIRRKKKREKYRILDWFIFLSWRLIDKIKKPFFS
jgi:hypothetical protein